MIVMKARRLLIRTELYNVARRFRKAIYRERRIDKYYPSYKEAARHHNMSKCDYCWEYENGERSPMHYARRTRE